MEAAIGVLGLSLQLVDSAVKVKRAIGNYRSASTEINRLALKVERVEAICGAIRKSFEAEPSTRQCSELIETWGVCVLRSVQSALVELHDIITKLEKKAATKIILNAAGMAFLARKDDILRLSKWLDDDLNHLQHMMTTEIFSRCNVVQQLMIHQPETQAASSTAGRTLPAPSSDPCTNVSVGPSVTTTITLTNRNAISAFGFRGQAQSARILKKSRWQNVDETTSITEVKTYAFGLSGISYRVELQWQLSTLSPVVYTMSVRHIISMDTDLRLVKEISDAMCVGDLLALQNMLSAKRITLGSLVGRNTLFELAAISHQPTICRFLAQQNLGLCLDEQICRPNYASSYSWQGREASESRRRVLEIDDVVQLAQVSRASKFRLLAYRLQDIESLVALYDRYIAPSIDETEKEDFIDAVWDSAIQLFTFQARAQPFWLRDDPLDEVWTELFARLINEGVNVHRHVSFGPGFPGATKGGNYSTLFRILNSCPCHRQVEVALSRWLRLLRASGIDVEEYLQCEPPRCQMIPGRPGLDSVWVQLLGTKMIEGFEVPFWRRYVDPGSKAYQVRREFKNFGFLQNIDVVPVCLSFVVRVARNSHRPHVTMKACNMDVYAEEDWPFRYSLVRDSEIDFSDMSYVTKEERDSAQQSFQYARELMRRRFDRRQTRKLYKSGYLRREKRPLRMPGAWPNSE